MSSRVAGYHFFSLAFFLTFLVGISDAKLKNTTTIRDQSARLPEVTIPQGRLQGINLLTRNKRFVSAFLGIPYAQPPIGKLRFSSPVAAGTWVGTWNASVDGTPCLQGVNLGDEDCLYLNVYTPQHLPNSREPSLLPVMVYIPGGGFAAGSAASNLYGPGHLLDADIILVSMNYRVGALGFFSTGDEVAPGNWGLKDQVLALQWVQDNIAFFGGDPEQVTIFGQSAGGSSVQLLALSESTIGLFHKFISESGGAFGSWVHRPRSSYVSVALQLGEFLGCPTDTSSLLVDCLRELDASEIMNTVSNFSAAGNRYPLLMWGPTDEPDIEGAFLTDTPQNLFAAGKIRDLPSMTGTVPHEGVIFMPGTLADSITFDEFIDNFDDLLLSVLNYPGRIEDVPSFVATVKELYFDNDLTSNRTQLWSNCVKLLSDAFFIYPIYKAVRMQSAFAENAPYFYSFEYRGTHSNGDVYHNNDVVKTTVIHGDELLYLFPQMDTLFGSQSTNQSLQHGSRFDDVGLRCWFAARGWYDLSLHQAFLDRVGASRSKELSKADIKMIETMVELWTSFATNGIPTTTAAIGNTIWTPYSFEENYLRIGTGSDPSISTQYNFIQERMQFWYNTIG